MIIEADSPDCISIQDNHSLNKTWKNNIALKPGVLYGLEDGDLITMGEVKLTFSRRPFADSDSAAAAKDKDAFQVPETPMPKKSVAFAPVSQSSPAPNSSSSGKPPLLIPDTPESPDLAQRRSTGGGLDDSSFICPSQPQPQRSLATASVTSRSEEKSSTSEASSMNVFDMETQKVVEDVSENSTTTTDSIFIAETQKVDCGNATEVDPARTAKESIYDEETQVVDTSGGHNGSGINGAQDLSRGDPEKGVSDEPKPDDAEEELEDTTLEDETVDDGEVAVPSESKVEDEDEEPTQIIEDPADSLTKIDESISRSETAPFQVTEDPSKEEEKEP